MTAYKKRTIKIPVSKDTGIFYEVGKAFCVQSVG